MMISQLRKIITDYFGFNRTETNGLILVFLLMIILIFVPYIFRILNSSESQIDAGDLKILDSLLTSLEVKSTQEYNLVEKEENAVELFSFNPNTSSVTELISLGIGEPIAKRIIKYRQAGGVFRIKNDLQKIYGLPEETYSKLFTHIELPEKAPVKEVSVIEKENLVPNENHIVENISEPIKIDINSTDTAELRKIKGIGQTLSTRIIKYGNMLGGFVSIDQLNDVYGLKGDALENIKLKAFVERDFKPAKLKINFADWYTLVKHPYINKDLANDLISIRSNVGPYRKIDDLMTIKDMSDSLLIKLGPYLEF